MITHLQKWSLLALWAAGSLSAQEWKPSDWPVLKHYDKEHLFQIALPLGGIGTGTVSLGGRGELRDWEIMNVPGKKYSTVTTGNNAPFFSIYVKSQDNIPVTTLLEGPLYTQSWDVPFRIYVMKDVYRSRCLYFLVNQCDGLG